jgi:hypothetical protein
MYRSAFRSLVVLPFFVAAVACGGSGGEGTTTNAEGGAGAAADGEGGVSGSESTTADGGSADDGASPAPGMAKTVDVHGSVASYTDAPIVGRSVRVLDASGTHVDVVTDAAGHFEALGVASPYDVRVSPEGLTDAATIYLGIHDASPYLHAELATTPQAVVTQTFNVGALLATACATCEVSFVTKSPHGGGGVTTNFPAGSSVASVALTHSFVSDGSPSEPVTLHVLVYDAGRTWFRYEEASLTAVAGRTSPGGVHTPQLVSVHPLTVSLQAAGVPASWRPDLLASLVFSDGAATSILDTRGMPLLLTNVPVISGATLSAYGWSIDPIEDTDPTIGDDVQTRSGKFPMSTSAIVLSATAPLHDIIPAPHSTISRKGPGLSWSAPASTVTELVLIDAAHGRSVAAVLTEGVSVTWEKLDALGVSVTPGELSLNLAAVAHAGLSAVVAGDASIRRPLYDWSAAGSCSYQRWQFTLTP